MIQNRKQVIAVTDRAKRPSSVVLGVEVFSPGTLRASNEKFLGLETLDTLMIMTMMIKITIYLHR